MIYFTLIKTDSFKIQCSKFFCKLNSNKITLKFKLDINLLKNLLKISN